MGYGLDAPPGLVKGTLRRFMKRDVCVAWEE